MRRGLPPAWAALLAAACAMDLTGAPCDGDGNCPTSQRCEAGRCVASATDPACTADGLACEGDVLRRCATNAGSCHYAVRTDCAAVAAGMSCTEQGNVSGCQCPDNQSGEFRADAASGSGDGDPFFPTGLSDPPQCRYRSLSRAVAAAAEKAPAAVLLDGATAGSEMVFRGEALPIEVPSGVGIAPAELPATKDRYVLELDSLAAPQALRVRPGGSVHGLKIRDVSGSATATGIAVDCSSGSGAVTLGAVAVEGVASGTSLASGIAVVGPCAVSLSDASVTRARGSGLRVESGAAVTAVGVTLLANGGSGATATGSGSSLALSGGPIQGNAGSGVEVLAGATAALAGSATNRVEIAGNAQAGIRVEGDLAASGATVSFANVHDNGDGAVVQNAAAGGVDIADSLFAANANAGIRVDSSGRDPGRPDGFSTRVARCGVSGGRNGVVLWSSGELWASLTDSTVSGNSEIGLGVAAAPTSAIAVSGNVITGNAGSTAYGRKVGGVLLYGPAPSFSFGGNAVYRNGGDQVLVTASTWDLRPPSGSCAAANVISCYDAGWVGIATLGDSVDAQFTSWQSELPASSVDYVGSVDATNSCPAATVSCN